MNNEPDRERQPAAPCKHVDDKTDDPSLLWAEIHHLRSAMQGPTGFVTWQDAAEHERILRVRAERQPAALSEGLVFKIGDRVIAPGNWEAKITAIEPVKYTATYGNGYTQVCTAEQLKPYPTKSTAPTQESDTNRERATDEAVDAARAVLADSGTKEKS